MSHNFCYNYSFLSDWMKANPHIKRMDLLNTLEMCDYGTLAKWLNGVTMMPLTQIMKFCNRYNVPITAFFYDELADDNSVFSPLHIDAMIEPANGWPDSNRKAGIKVCDPRSTEHIVSNLPKYVRLAANIQSKKRGYYTTTSCEYNILLSSLWIKSESWSSAYGRIKWFIQ